MKFLRVVRGGVICLLVAVCGTLPTQAQQAKSGQAQQGAEPSIVRMGVINLEEIDQKAALFKSIRAQMEQYRTAFQAAIKSEEDELRKADKELARQRAILSAEAYAEERRKFEKSVVDFQRQAQQRKQNLSVVYNKAIVEAQTHLRKIVEQYAKENNIALVLRSDTVAYYLQALDMTGIILDRLDKAVPSIKVPKPEQ